MKKMINSILNYFTRTYSKVRESMNSRNIAQTGTAIPGDVREIVTVLFVPLRGLMTLRYIFIGVISCQH
jgi:hypothetical protein